LKKYSLLLIILLFEIVILNLIPYNTSWSSIRDDLKNSGDETSMNLTFQIADQIYNGCEYLIITHENFAEAIEILAQDKNKHGISTKIVNTSSICENPTPENISDFIKEAYETWNPQPKYILLVGDVNFIPCHRGRDYDVSTDLYYATVNGSDYFPDLNIGRFPVQNNDELMSIINKTINYEENYNPKLQIFRKVLLAAYNQSDGIDRYYITTSENISEFLEANSYYTTRIYSGSGQNGTTEDIISSINEGVLILNHRDHGIESGWSYPSFTISDIEELNNPHFQPVMFSINCLSGNFGYHSDCFGEAILKAENKGISAFIGASTVSYSGYNDELNKGLFASIFPGYYPNYSNGNVSRSEEMGGVLNFGKMFMYDKYYLTNGEGYRWSATEKITRLQFEILNLLGDPALAIIDNIAPEIYNLSLKSDILELGDTQKIGFHIREKFALDTVELNIKDQTIIEKKYNNSFFECFYKSLETGNITYDIKINDTSGNFITLSGYFTVRDNGNLLKDILFIMFLSIATIILIYPIIDRFLIRKFIKNDYI
jgi:hypothetical protein